MPFRFLIALLPLLVAALLAGCTHPDKSPATGTVPPPPAAVAPPPPAEEYLPPLQYGYGSGWTDALKGVQELIVLPFGTPVPADTGQVVVCFEVRSWGATAEVQVLRGLSPAVDSAVQEAVYQLPFQGGRSMYEDSIPHSYKLTIPAPGAASAAQRREATTRWLRTAVRRPGEADTTFVQRVLPLSYWRSGYNDLQALAWRPGRYGRQLVFTQRALRPCYDGNGSRNWHDTEVFVLDPFRPRTYAVQALHLTNIGDLNGQQANAFVADVNHDGRPDLVTLLTYSQSVAGPGHMDYYRVEVLRTAGLDQAGRPRYRLDATPYPYLEYRQDETPGPHPEEFTPATVRRLLARHWRHRRRPTAPPRDSASIKPTEKAGAASPQESDSGQ